MLKKFTIKYIDVAEVQIGYAIGRDWRIATKYNKETAEELRDFEWLGGNNHNMWPSKIFGEPRN